MKLRAIPMHNPDDGSDGSPVRRNELATARTQLRAVGADGARGQEVADCEHDSAPDNPGIGTLQTMASDPAMLRGQMPDALQFTRTLGGTGPGTDPPADAGLKNLVMSRLFPSRGPVKIGRYTILDRLGAGGMGIVYAAYDDRLDRKVAVKVLRQQTKNVDATGRTRLLREAQAMARLSHPNIVTVHESGEHEGEVFLAMEFVRGRSLDRWFREQSRSWREVLDVFLLAGRGLQAAHAAGLVHRDFKPQNVLIAEDGAVKVMDFGLARATGEASPEPVDVSASDPATGRLLDLHLTSTGAIMGTPAYMAPEQHLGQPVTPRTDQFNFCVALYEGLFGQLPFPTDNLVHLVDSVISGRIAAPPNGHGVPQWVHRLVLRGLAVDPETRHASMGDLLTALARDPAKRRRRVLSFAAFAGVVALATYMATSTYAAGQQPCDDIADEIHTVWNSDRAHTVEQALATTHSDYAHAAWQKVSPALDSYRDDWLTARGDSCDAHQRGLLSSHLYDLQSNCLNQRRAHFETVVDTLEHADKAVAQRAVEATTTLPRLDRCGDAQALMADIPLPEDQQEAEAVQQSRLQLARARSFETLAKFEEGIALADEVLAAPHAQTYPALHSEALLTKGSLQLERADPGEVVRILDRAALQALELGHDRVAAEALVKKLYAQGFRSAQSARALEDVPTVQALVRRTHDRELEALLLNNRTAVLFRNRDHTRADEVGAQALQLKQEVYGASHPQYAFTLVNLGLNSVQAGKYHRAEDYQRQAYEVLARQLGPKHPYSAMVQYNIGIALQRQAKQSQAEMLIREALETYSTAVGPRTLEVAEMLETLGHIELDQRNYAHAIETFRRAQQIRSDHGVEPLTQVQVTHAIARALSGAGRYAEAKELHMQGLATRLASLAPTHPDVLDSRIDIANAAIERSDWPGALAAADDLLAHASESRQTQVRAHKYRSAAKREQGDLEGSAADIEHALDLYARAELENDLLLTKLHREAGETALVQNDLELAWSHLTAAHRISASNRGPQHPETIYLNYKRAVAADHLVGEQRLGSEILRHLKSELEASLAQLTPHYEAEANEIKTWLKRHI